ncbi:hypothetical protein C1S80_29970 [Mycolicibacterium aubagnense]|nr:hypothetical protein C1S80_29970 [Mycolicibacterium aubagnense]
MSTIAIRVAAEIAAQLSGRTADDLGWPDRRSVARHFASATLSGLSREQFGDDPAGWCIEVLVPAIEHRLPGPDTDLRAIGWPHVPTVAANIARWLVDDGVFTQEDNNT